MENWFLGRIKYVAVSGIAQESKMTGLIVKDLGYWSTQGDVS